MVSKEQEFVGGWVDYVDEQKYKRSLEQQQQQAQVDSCQTLAVAPS